MTDTEMLDKLLNAVATHFLINRMTASDSDQTLWDTAKDIADKRGRRNG